MASQDRFVDRYRDADPEDLPWFHAEPDPDLLALFNGVLPEPAARVLDLGAGPSVHGIKLAARGHRVTCIDGVPEARDMAMALAERRGVALDYRVGDAIRETPEGPFDLILDRGFLHTLEPGERPVWRAAVAGALAEGGSLVIKCFDRRPPRDFGPTGLTAREVVEALGNPEPGGLALERLARTRFPGHAGRPHATWTVLARRL